MNKFRHFLNAQIPRYVPTNSIAHLRYRRNGKTLRKSSGLRNVQSAPFSDKVIRDIQNFITEQTIRSSYRLSEEDSQILYGNPKVGVLLQKNTSCENVARLKTDGLNDGNYSLPGDANQFDNQFSSKDPSELAKSYSQLINDYSQEIQNRKEKNRDSSTASIESISKTRYKKAFTNLKDHSSSSKREKTGKTSSVTEDLEDRRAQWLEKILDAHRAKRRETKNVSKEVAKTLSAYKRKPSESIVTDPKVKAEEKLSAKTSVITTDGKSNLVENEVKVDEHSIASKVDDVKSTAPKPEKDRFPSIIKPAKGSTLNPIDSESKLIANKSNRKEVSQIYHESANIKLEVQRPIVNETKTNKSALNSQVSTKIDKDENDKPAITVVKLLPTPGNKKGFTRTNLVRDKETDKVSLTATQYVQQLVNKSERTKYLENRSMPGNLWKSVSNLKNNPLPWWAMVKEKENDAAMKPTSLKQNKMLSSQTSKGNPLDQKNISHKEKVSKSNVHEILFAQGKKVFNSGKATINIDEITKTEDNNVLDKSKGLTDSRKSKLRRRRKMNSINKVITSELEKQNERIIDERKRKKVRSMSTNTKDSAETSGPNKELDLIGAKTGNEFSTDKKPKKLKDSNKPDDIKKIHHKNKLVSSPKQLKNPQEENKDELKTILKFKDHSKNLNILSKDVRVKQLSMPSTTNKDDKRNKLSTNISDAPQIQITNDSSIAVKENERKLSSKISDQKITKADDKKSVQDQQATKLSSKLNASNREQSYKNSRVVNSTNPQIKNEDSKIYETLSKSQLIKNKLRELAALKRSEKENEKMDYAELIANDKRLRTNITKPKKGQFIDYTIQEPSPISDKTTAGQSSYAIAENASAEKKVDKQVTNEKMKPFIVNTKKGDLIDYGHKTSNDKSAPKKGSKINLVDYGLKYSSYSPSPMDDSRVVKESRMNNDIVKNRSSSGRTTLVRNLSNSKTPKKDSNTSGVKSKSSKSSIQKETKTDEKQAINQDIAKSSTDIKKNSFINKTSDEKSVRFEKKEVKLPVRNMKPVIMEETSKQDPSFNQSAPEGNVKTLKSAKKDEFNRYKVKLNIEASDPKSAKKKIDDSALALKPLDNKPAIVEHKNPSEQKNIPKQDKAIVNSSKTVKPANIRLLIEEAVQDKKSNESKTFDRGVIDTKSSKKYIIIKKSKDESPGNKLPAVPTVSKSSIKNSSKQGKIGSKLSSVSLSRPNTANPITDKKLTPKELKNKIDGTQSNKVHNKTEQEKGTGQTSPRRRSNSPQEKKALKSFDLKNTKSDFSIQRSTSSKPGFNSKQNLQRKSASFANNAVPFEQSRKKTTSVPSRDPNKQANDKTLSEINTSKVLTNTKDERDKYSTSHSIKSRRSKTMRSSSTASAPDSGFKQENFLIQEVSDDAASAIKKLLEDRKAQKKKVVSDQERKISESKASIHKSRLKESTSRGNSKSDTSLKEKANLSKSHKTDKILKSTIKKTSKNETDVLKTLPESIVSESQTSVKSDVKSKSFSKMKSRLMPSKKIHSKNEMQGSTDGKEDFLLKNTDALKDNPNESQTNNELFDMFLVKNIDKIGNKQSQGPLVPIDMFTKEKVDESSLKYYEGKKSSKNRPNLSDSKMPPMKHSDMFLKIESNIENGNALELVSDEMGTFVVKRKSKYGDVTNIGTQKTRLSKSAKVVEDQEPLRDFLVQGQRDSKSKEESEFQDAEDHKDMFLNIHADSTSNLESKETEENFFKKSDTNGENKLLLSPNKQPGGNDDGSGNSGFYSTTGHSAENSEANSPDKESKSFEDTVTDLVTEKQRDRFLTGDELNRFSLAHLPRRSSKFYQQSAFTSKKNLPGSEHHDLAEKKLMYAAWSNRFDRRYVSKHIERMDSK